MWYESTRSKFVFPLWLLLLTVRFPSKVAVTEVRHHLLCSPTSTNSGTEDSAVEQCLKSTKCEAGVVSVAGVSIIMGYNSTLYEDLARYLGEMV